MNTLTKKIVLSGLVLLLSACVHYPRHYGSYPSDGPYYHGYGNYQGHHHHYYPRPPAPSGYWGRGRPYGGHHSNNYYYQNNYYGRPQPKPRPMPSHGHHDRRNTPPEGRYDRPDSRWPSRRGDHGSRPQNFGDWHTRNGHPQHRPEFPAHRSDRHFPHARRDDHPDGRRSGQHRNSGDHPQSLGSWNGRPQKNPKPSTVAARRQAE